MRDTGVGEDALTGRTVGGSFTLRSSVARIGPITDRERIFSRSFFDRTYTDGLPGTMATTHRRPALLGTFLRSIYPLRVMPG